MWPDRRLVELFEIDHPIVLAPMAGLGTVDLAAAVSNAGGLGSIGCAVMAPESVAKTVAELRRLTTKPINLNFFCHDPAKADAARERAWHEKLSSYYRELGIDRATSTPRLDLAPFGDAACAAVEHVKPEVVSFHLFRFAPAQASRSAQGSRLQGDLIGDDGRRSMLARKARRRCDHRSGGRSRRTSRHIPRF